MYLGGPPGDQKHDIHLTLHVGLRLQCNYQASSLSTLRSHLLHPLSHLPNFPTLGN